MDTVDVLWESLPDLDEIDLPHGSCELCGVLLLFDEEEVCEECLLMEITSCDIS